MIKATVLCHTVQVHVHFTKERKKKKKQGESGQLTVTTNSHQTSGNKEITY